MAKPKVKKVYKKEEILAVTPQQMSKMSRQEIRYLVSSASRMIGSQRSTLAKIEEETGWELPSRLQKNLDDGVNAFNPNGTLKTTNQLRHELSVAQKIMTNKAYTKAGLELYYSHREAQIKLILGTDEKGKQIMPTKEDRQKLNSIFNRLGEKIPHYRNYISSDQIIDVVKESFKEMSVDDLVAKLEAIYDKAYTKEKADEQVREGGISNGFKLQDIQSE